MIKKLLFLTTLLPLLSCSLILNKMPADTDEEGDLETDTDADMETDDGTTEGETDGSAECGNGAIEEGEECDDGNDISGDGCEDDCTYTCEVDADCRDESMCNGEESCNTASHTCEAGAALEDGTVCAAEPRSICLDGDCAVSSCGDGFVDLGGGEFCEPPGEANCSDECILLCEDNEDCPDDGEVCNGVEECMLETGECVHVYALDDGVECGTDPRRICIAQTCQDSVCGDGYVDEDLDPAEECDDMNTTADDGCENDCTFTCRINSDCDDGRTCTDDRCDIISHTCAAFIADPGEVCRPVAGPCDVEEACDGDSADCPADAFLGSSVVCRGSAGMCDVEETCDGSGPDCPADAFRPDTFECRASTRPCDPAETCPGDGPLCPGDEYDCGCTGDSDCPGDGNPCNGDEYCDTSSGECARSSPPAEGTVCQSSPRMICIAQACLLSSCGDGFKDAGAGEECDDGNGVAGDGCEGDCTYSCHDHTECNDGKICTTDVCNAATHMCQHTSASSSTLCRAAAGGCDVPEYCTGTSSECPDDLLQPEGTPCGPAGTACTGRAECTGISPECPAPPIICWHSVDGGDNHTCGIKDDLQLFCWGSNGSGQLGTGLTTGSRVPVPVEPGTPWEVVTAGGQHSCAVDMDQKLYCWGANSSGQLGDGTNSLKRVPTPVLGIEVGWTDVCAGYVHSCGISGGILYCWGANGSGQLGIGLTGGTYNTPQPVETVEVVGEWMGITCGYQHTCAYTNSRDGYCWGDNEYGQLGDATFMDRNRPTLIHRGGTDTAPWSAMASGDFHTCAISDGLILCWGQNTSHQIGDGSSTNRNMPTAPAFTVYTPGIMLSTAAGGLHSCVTDDRRDGYCWGDNDYGQLGINSNDTRASPVQILETDWGVIEAGKYHTCAIKFSPPNLFCWGRNGQGQVGDGTVINKLVPTQIIY